MIQQTVARPRWRAIFVAAPALLCMSASLIARPLRAQFRMSWDANAAITQFDTPTPSLSTLSPLSPTRSVDPRWLGQRTMGAAIRYSHPLLQLSADGVMRDGDVSSHLTGGIFASLASPGWKGFRVSGSYDRRHIPNDGVKSFQYDTLLLASWASPPQNLHTWQSTASASISYARNATGVWLRANRYQGFSTSDSLSDWSLASGVTQQLRSVSIGVLIGARNRNTSVLEHTGQHIDSFPKYSPLVGGKVDTTYEKKLVGGDSSYVHGWQRWAEATGVIGWSRGRFALDASLSARPRLAGYEATMWGDLSAVASITSRVAILAATRSSPRLPGIAYSAQRIASLGLRVSPPAFWRPVPLIPIRSTSTRFRVEPTGSGNYTITLNVPNARSVELAGDFTAWEAVKLRQIDATRWEISLPVAPGSHRCNVRIDGAEWVPPPGIPSIADEFNGRVGLFIAQ